MKYEEEEYEKGSGKEQLHYKNANNDIDFYRILSGTEQRTTVMVRNIPNKFKQGTLLEMINKNHSQRYDYFYLPMDLKVSFSS